MTDEARKRIFAGLTAEEVEEKIKKYEALRADLDEFIAQNWTGGKENGEIEA